MNKINIYIHKFYYLGAIFLFALNTFAQTAIKSDIKLQAEYGSKNIDVMNILYFEDIALSKVTLTGNELTGKDFQISIMRFDKGQLTKTEIAFDSKKEGDYFKIKNNEFVFRVLNKITPENKARFQFQFNGFSVTREYAIDKKHKAYALKDFTGNRKEISIPLNERTYFLTYMLPFEKPDGSTQYCEVVQSGTKPEELGAKYAIPTYFLIGITLE